jgi:hypothetical protein
MWLMRLLNLCTILEALAINGSTCSLAEPTWTGDSTGVHYRPWERLPRRPCICSPRLTAHTLTAERQSLPRTGSI